MLRLAILQAIAGDSYAVTARGRGGKFGSTPNLASLGHFILITLALVLLLAVALAFGPYPPVR